MGGVFTSDEALRRIKESQDFQTWFEKQRAAYQFAGKAGGSHCVFIFNADTAELEGREPWQKITESKRLDEVLEFIVSQKGPKTSEKSKDKASTQNKSHQKQESDDGPNKKSRRKDNPSDTPPPDP
jgi:hypothetical protein